MFFRISVTWAFKRCITCPLLEIFIFFDFDLVGSPLMTKNGRKNFTRQIFTYDSPWWEVFKKYIFNCEFCLFAEKMPKYWFLANFGDFWRENNFLHVNLHVHQICSIDAASCVLSFKHCLSKILGVQIEKSPKKWFLGKFYM